MEEKTKTPEELKAEALELIVKSLNTIAVKQYAEHKSQKDL